MRTVNTKYILSILGVVSGIAGAQTRPQDKPPRLNEQDKKTVTQIAELQFKIEQLECQANDYQMQLKDLVRKASAPVRANLVGLNAKPAIILNTNGETFIVNAGTRNNGLRVGDKLLVVERGPDNSLRVKGTGLVVRAYDKDVECDGIDNRGIRPENEVYVLNRCSSPYYITRLKFALEDM